jgi:hypothetical protein
VGGNANPKPKLGLDGFTFTLKKKLLFVLLKFSQKGYP